MNQTVWGSCVEPDGMNLDSSRIEDECPECKAPDAVFWFWQSCAGGAINNHSSVHCHRCGYTDDDGADEDLPGQL